MFTSLQDKLESAFKNLKGQARITEINIAATVKDIRRALVDADVNYKIEKEFTDKIKDKAMGEKVINAISPGQLMVKIVKDELTDLMGGSESEFNITGNPAVILIAGLQGSGKTTFSGSLITSYASIFAYFAFFSINSRLGGTSSPMSILKMRSASAALSIVTCRRVLELGFIVVSQSCSAFISPRPL